MRPFMYYYAQFILKGVLPNTDPNDVTTNHKFLNIVQVVLVTLGTIAVLMIALGGIRYILSRGDPKNIAKARNAILYAIIGLVIAMSADIIVGFVTKNL